MGDSTFSCQAQNPEVNSVVPSILTSKYKPKEPEEVRTEKRLGITRKTLILYPIDAIIFQTLSNYMEPGLLKEAPSENAFYTRTVRFSGMEEVDETFPYPWYVLWPEFQKRIWKFTEYCEFVVTTDIANYYDTVSLSVLRNSLNNTCKFDESTLDLLFYMLESFVWRPNYIPSLGLGLPQINYDAPRLLAHAFLFRIDEFLKSQTQSNYVRWMDDIDFGASSLEDAKKMLGNLEINLNKIGLRLNTGKTKIISSQEAKKYFWIQENRSLTIIKNSMEEKSYSTDLKKKVKGKLRRMFKVFFKSDRIGSWEKILKRYFNMFAGLNDSSMDKIIPEILTNYPSLRTSIFRYYERIGFSVKRFAVIEDYLLNGNCIDDESVFGAFKLISEWKIPKGNLCVERAIVLAKAVGNSDSTTATRLISSIWIIAKYCSQSEICKYVVEKHQLWRESDWVARQFAAIYPLLDFETRIFLRDAISSAGLLEVFRVIANIEHIEGLENLDKSLQGYFYAKQRYYPMQKVILARSIVLGEINIQQYEKLKNSIYSQTKDYYLRRMLIKKHAKF